MYKPPGTFIWRGDLTEGFLCYRFEELIFGGAYTWRSLINVCHQNSKENKAKTVNFLLTIRLAQLILKRKFPSIDKPVRI